MAHIAKVEGKRGVVWRLRVNAKDAKSGKRKTICRTFKRKGDAEAEGRRLEGLRDGGALRAPSREPLKVYLETWLNTVAVHRVRPRTLADYEAILKRYIFEPPEGAPHLGTFRVHQLSAEAFQALYTWMAGQGLSPRTIEALHAVLRSALNKGVATGALAVNPTRHAERPKRQRKETPALNEEEVGRFLRAAQKDAHAALWVLLLATGLRPGEALALKWADLDGARLRVQRSLTRRGVKEAARRKAAAEEVTRAARAAAKGGRVQRSATVKGWEFSEPKTDRANRTVAVPEMAAEALRAHERAQRAQRAARLLKGESWAEHGLIFTSETGEPLDWANLYKRSFLPILKAAELGTWAEDEKGRRTFVPAFHPYSLRHTFASLALRHGINVKEVSAALGHASITLTLDTYTHLIESQQERVADAMQGVLASVV